MRPLNPSKEKSLTPEVRTSETEAHRRIFVLQFVQPGLAGLMDGSVSTLAPVFASALATQKTTTHSSSVWRHLWARVSLWRSLKVFPTMAR